MVIIESQYFSGPMQPWVKGSPDKDREPEDVDAACHHQTDVSEGFGVSPQALERHDGDYDAALFERFEGSEYLSQKDREKLDEDGNPGDGKVGEPYHYVYRPQERRVLAIHHPERRMWHGNGANDKSIGIAVDGEYPGDELDTKQLAFAVSSIIEHAYGLGFAPKWCDHHRQSSSGRGGDAGEEIARVVEGVGLPLGITVRPDHTQGSGQTIPDSWRARSSANAPSGCDHPTLNIPKMPSGTRDESVITLQSLLLGLGYGPEGLEGEYGLPDGKPGRGTERELRRFQTVRGLTADAICGDATWDALLP